MLVIDGVELRLLDQPEQVREFERDHAAGLERGLQPADEIVDVGNMGEDVVAADEVGRAVGQPRSASALAEEIDDRRDALASATSAVLAVGSTPRHGDARAWKFCSR